MNIERRLFGFNLIADTQFNKPESSPEANPPEST